jgi:hypothetical protein
VVTDLASMAMAYDAHGAQAMSRAMGADTFAGRAFALQAQSDNARAVGDIGTAELLGRDAAFQLGVHEQVRLQTMWDDPVLNAMGKVNGMLQNSWLSSMARPLDIYVGANKYTDRPSQGLGYMKAPASLPNKDVTQLGTRLEIARNAFNFMYEARQDQGKYNILQNSFTRLYDGTSLYKLPTVLQPQPRWRL